MKIVIFSQFFPPEMEPSGFMFSSLAKSFAKSDKVKQVDVVCGFANFPKGSLSIANGIRFSKRAGKME